MPNEKFFVIKEDGTTERWILDKQTVNIAEAISQDFAQGVRRKVDRLMNIGLPNSNYGMIGFSAIQGENSVWSVEVLKLAMECPWDVKEGIATPVFNNPGFPVMAMKWKPPTGMRLLLVITILHNGGFYQTSTQHLVAVDKDRRMYQLPLSNLYKDLKLCHGLDGLQKNHTDAWSAVNEALTQFSKSRWNADLLGGNPVGQYASKMFKFVVKDDGFEQLPPEGNNWIQWSLKVGNDYLTNNISNLSM